MSRTRSQDRLAAGARIGNYRIERELGSSPIYATYEAAHVVLPRLALIKVMHAHVAAMQPFAVQMLREACILEALRHPGVPAVFESGLLADKRPWFALERVDGDPLIARLADGLLAPFELAGMVRDVAAVLAHAHRRGVIHGSLKPERIVLAAGHRGFPVCVVDWSDARPHDALARGPATPDTPMPGSRTFVAPEVARGDQIDDRADVYALGVIAYQAMTGALPYDGAIYISAHERCPQAPRELCSVIDQMLALDRFDRPSSAEVRDQLAWPAEPRTETDRDVPIEDVELIALPDGPMPRIRKPRWTPAVVSGDYTPGSDEATLPERLPE